MRKAFTLIELTVVIAILAILATVVVLTLNPAGLLQESRDASRLSDMATLNNAVSYSLADNAGEPRPRGTSARDLDCQRCRRTTPTSAPHQAPTVSRTARVGYP
ncbi:MAG: prepilin-type N-terminal cleavage/methylation domain-containing protein [Bryobacteraceae bacterium]